MCVCVCVCVCVCAELERSVTLERSLLLNTGNGQCAGAIIHGAEPFLAVGCFDHRQPGRVRSPAARGHLRHLINLL